MVRTKFKSRFRRTRFERFPSRSGIYRIQSIVNNKQYVGSAVNLKNRKGVHVRSLKKNCGSPYMQNHANKHGIDVLKFFILEFCLKGELIEREQYWMDTLNPEFNLSPTAGSNLGVKYSEESKQKISDNHADFSGENHPGFGSRRSEGSKQKNSETKKAFYQTEEGIKLRKEISERNKGWKPSEESNRRRSAALKGRKRPKEVCLKIALGNKGKIVSEETKQKNRKSQIKRMANPELRQKLREAALKQWQNHSEETKRKINRKGSKHLEETKRKMSESHKGQTTWNKGLTKETDPRIKQMSEVQKGEKSYWFGKYHSEETKRKMSKSLLKYNAYINV